MFVRSFIQTRIVLATGMLCAWATFDAALAQSTTAQRQPAMMFFDQRRLPDMEVERRNQEVLVEQRRVEEQRRTEAEASERNKATAARLAAEAQREAQRKIDEAGQLAEATAAKRDADRKAEQDKKAAAVADSEAKRVAEEARLATEAKRKADEDKQIAAAAEAETKRKAEEARLAKVASESSRAAELAKLAAEATQARRKADEAALAATPSVPKTTPAPPATPAANQTAALVAPAAPAPVPVPAVKPAANVPTGTCGAPKTGLTSLPAGRIQLAIQSACRLNEPVTLAYGDVTLARKLDGAGNATIFLDQIFGSAVGVTVRFVDGSSTQLLPVALPPTPNPISKVAIIWEKNVDLNLHALEAGAAIGKPGHVWSGGNTSPQQAEAAVVETGRGAGWISMADDGRVEGTKMEVYTFTHSPEQTSGVVAMAIEHASRGATATGDMCGSGALADVPFDVVILDSKGQVSRDNGIIPALTCGQPVSLAARYLREVVPDLRLRR